MVIPRDASDAWKAGHVFAKLLDSRVIHDVVLDSESPWHCHCPGGVLPIRRGKHCDCPAKNVERAPPKVQHNVITDAESPAHCLCPGSEVPVRYGDGHCACFDTHWKRQNDPVPISSGGLSKAVVTAIKSAFTAPKLSVTGPSTLVPNAKSSTTQHNSSESTAKVTTVAVKATLPSAIVSTITKAIKGPQPADEEGSQPDESESSDIIDAPVTLPILHGPVLVCLLGACFVPSELSSFTSGLGLSKRAEYRNIGDVPHISGACDEHNISVCLQDHKTCFCHISKRQATAALAFIPEEIPQEIPEPITPQCPDKDLLICGTSLSSCHCIQIPTEPLSPAAPSCNTGALICFQGLCYCPLVNGRADQSSAVATSPFEAGLGPMI